MNATHNENNTKNFLQRILTKFMLPSLLIFQQVRFLMYTWEIYMTLHVSFYTIIFNNIRIKNYQISVSITYNHLQEINIDRWRINSQKRLLAHSVFYVSIDTYDLKTDVYVRKWCLYNSSIEVSKGGRNTQHSMLDIFKEKTASR